MKLKELDLPDLQVGDVVDPTKIRNTKATITKLAATDTDKDELTDEEK